MCFNVRFRTTNCISCSLSAQLKPHGRHVNSNDVRARRRGQRAAPEGPKEFVLDSPTRPGPEPGAVESKPLLRPPKPVIGLEPKAKRKVAMHVAYVGTPFRGDHLILKLHDNACIVR
jgi:hypothetical protein